MAFECPRRSSPPSPMFDADTGCIATDPAPSARRRFRSKTGIENLPANEHAQETPHTPSPTRTTRRIQSGCAGSYKDSEVKDFLDRAAIRWPIEFRRVGAGKDGGADVRSFQRLVHQHKIALAENISLVTAITKSTLRRDGNGNPAVDRASARGRIDVLSAAVIAAGLAESAFDRPPKRRLRYVLAG